MHSSRPPSSAHRWVHCPASLDKRHQQPREESEEAAEGTAAHELLRECLSSGLDPEHYYFEDAEFYGHTVDADMVEHITPLVHRVRHYVAKGYELLCEYETQMPTIHEDAWGICDIRLYHPGKKHLIVIDLKYGAGIEVTAEDNEQGACYVIGNTRELEADGYEVHKRTFVIYQPRHWAKEDPWESWQILPATLEYYEAKLRKAAKAKQDKFNPGSWCKWCPRELTCPRLEAEFNEMLEEGPDGYTRLTPKELARRLDVAAALRSHLKALEEHALERLQLEESIPGYELKDTTSKRFWINEADARKELKKYLGAGMYEERVLKSPRQIELAGVSKAIVKKHTATKVSGQSLVKVKS